MCLTNLVLFESRVHIHCTVRGFRSFILVIFCDVKVGQELGSKGVMFGCRIM